VSDSIFDAAKRYQSDSVALRRWFHRHPEAIETA
jgi:metal-dependent amidase/aminoacylase/carboxypeptidase family protein